MPVCHQDVARDDMPAAFWLRDTIDPLEALALDLCRGRVLDVGAGVSLHSLELQRRGIAVAAIDVAPECVAIMRERGVRSAEAADMYAFEGGSFDTIICLHNGLDKVGRLADLPRFLGRMRELLASCRPRARVGGTGLAGDCSVFPGKAVFVSPGSRRPAPGPR